jgi:signal transduction histidine kinase
MMRSIQSRVLLSIFVPVSLLILVLGVALSLPQSNLDFAAVDDQLVVRLASKDQQRVSGFSSGSGDFMAASGDLIIEEPDVLPTVTEYHDLLMRIDTLDRWATQSGLSAKTDQGEIDLIFEQRRISDLPFLFWLQLICSLIALVICALVWIPGKLSSGMLGFLITGLGYAIYASAAAIYSTRNLLIGHDLFFNLSLLNLFGSTFFGVGLVVFLWNHPKKLLPNWLIGLLVAYPFVALLLARFDLVETLATLRYLPHMLLLSGALIGLGLQWRAARGKPRDKVTISWMLISVLAGPTVFIVAIAIPVLLGLSPPASQGVVFTAFLLMFVSLFFAVTRSQVFDLARWSASLWRWLLGGLAVLAVDALLASMVSLSGPATLSLSLALVGWLYFPLRQFVWKRFFFRGSTGLDDWLERALPELIDETQDAGQQSRLTGAFLAVFKPMSHETGPINTQKPVIEGSGLRLCVPLLAEGYELRLSHADEGHRLFGPKDKRTAALILELDALVQRSVRAKSEGALEERTRIMRDLHDDLGAKLTRIMHRSEAVNKSLVREAIGDLRLLLTTQNHSSQTLQCLFARIQAEAEARAFEQQVTLVWQQDELSGSMDAGYAMQLSSAVREGVSNALKNYHSPKIEINVRCTDGLLEVQISNDTQAAKSFESVAGNVEGVDVQGESGMGLGNLKSRMQQIGGSVHIDQQLLPGELLLWKLTLILPL